MRVQTFCFKQLDYENTLAAVNIANVSCSYFTQRICNSRDEICTPTAHRSVKKKKTMDVTVELDNPRCF